MNELDKFYTKKEIAKECIDFIDNIQNYDCIIEPSAGNGSFSKQIPCIAYDIMPEDNSIIQQDFLLLSDKDFKKFNKILILGNPPFGKRSVLAKAFIKQAIKIGATTICFILPNTFSKLTNQNCFPKNWSLIKIKELNGTCFTQNGKDYYVPCSFYIWTKEKTDINLREIKYSQPEDFVFLKRGDLTADFTINGNNGKVKELSEITNPKAEHYIKVSNRDKIEQIKDIFKNIQYDFKSSVNGNNAWIGQQEIIKAFLLCEKCKN